LNRKEAVIKVRELFECAAVEGKASEPASEFFKGYLEGALSVLMRTKLQVREIECVARGDWQCTFITTMNQT
jgi:predicted hydrocarbon binding protein